MEGVLLDSAQLAKAAVDTAYDKKASDIILLDIRDVTTIADYFVICSGNNPRQIQAIAEAIDEELGKQGAQSKLPTQANLQLVEVCFDIRRRHCQDAPVAKNRAEPLGSPLDPDEGVEPKISF